MPFDGTDFPEAGVAAIYAAAIEQLERRGWCQHELVDLDTGAVCLVGALISADARRQHEVADAQAQLARLIPRTFMDLVHMRLSRERLWRWNDGPRRTEADVIGLLRRAMSAV